MSNRPFLIFGALAALVAVVGYLAFSKEGSEKATAVPVESADKEAADIFATNCGTCHTLAAAGTDGVVGPNLDEILPTQVAPPAGTSEEIAEANTQAYEGVYSRVLNAIVCGLEGRMPAGILQDQDAEEVARLRRRLRRPAGPGPGTAGARGGPLDPGSRAVLIGPGQRPRRRRRAVAPDPASDGAWSRIPGRTLDRGWSGLQAHIC